MPLMRVALFAKYTKKRLFSPLVRGYAFLTDYSLLIRKV